MTLRQNIQRAYLKRKRKSEIAKTNKANLAKLQRLYDQNDGFVRSVLGKRYIEGLTLWQWQYQYYEALQFAAGKGLLFDNA